MPNSKDGKGYSVGFLENRTPDELFQRDLAKRRGYPARNLQLQTHKICLQSDRSGGG